MRSGLGDEIRGAVQRGDEVVQALKDLTSCPPPGGGSWSVRLHEGLPVWTASGDASCTGPAWCGGLLVVPRHTPPILVGQPCRWEWKACGPRSGLRILEEADGMACAADLAPTEVLGIFELPAGLAARRRLALAARLAVHATTKLGAAGMISPVLAVEGAGARRRSSVDGADDDDLGSPSQPALSN